MKTLCFFFLFLFFLFCFRFKSEAFFFFSLVLVADSVFFFCYSIVCWWRMSVCAHVCDLCLFACERLFQLGSVDWRVCIVDGFHMHASIVWLCFDICVSFKCADFPFSPTDCYLLCAIVNLFFANLTLSLLLCLSFLISFFDSRCDVCVLDSLCSSF